MRASWSADHAGARLKSMPTDAERTRMDAERAERLSRAAERLARSSELQFQRQFAAGVSLSLTTVSELPGAECAMSEPTWGKVWQSGNSVSASESPPGEQAPFEFCGAKVRFDPFLPTGLVSFLVQGREPVMVRLYTPDSPGAAVVPAQHPPTPTPAANLENASTDLGGPS